MEIAYLVYKAIEEIGKEKIVTDVTSNINSSNRYMDNIIKKCLAKMNYEVNDKTLATLCEILLHFMLTICTLPSQRKIQIDNILLDIVIPNLQTLKDRPDKSLVIQVVKNNDSISMEEISQLSSLQPQEKNIWFVSAKPLQVKKYINYSVSFCDESNVYKFSDILLNIDKFLKMTGDKSLRLLP